MGIKLHSPVLERLAKSSNTRFDACEWPGCDEDAPHRAPYSRQEPNTFRWFCKSHAAKYNQAWNFFSDMTDEDVEAVVRYDTVWNRPSWPIGTGPALKAFMNGYFVDPFDAFDTKTTSDSTDTNDTSLSSIEPSLKRALTVFGLKSIGTESDVKQRYKELVKRHHPDAPGAKKGSDDRIKEINHAYTVILEFFAT